MQAKPLLILLLVVAVFIAATLSKTPERVLVEQWKHLPNGWVRAEKPDPETSMLFHIAVKQNNQQILEETLLEVSNPSSPRYSQHLSAREINELVAPDPSSIDIIMDWLGEHGVSSDRVQKNGNGDFLQVEVTVNEAEKLLDTTYYYFEHEHGHRILRTDSYSVPQQVFPHLDFVGPTIRFPVVRRSIRTRPNVGSANIGVNPTFLRNLYGVSNVTNNVEANQQCVAQFLEQYYDPKDLQLFFKKYSPSSEDQTPNVVGENEPDSPGTEATLDIEYIMSVGTNINTTFWSTSGRQPYNHENEPFLAFLYDLGNHTNPPTVVSISYGDNEDTVNFNYAVRVNVEFQKLGLQGISIMSASGDGGVAGSQQGPCKGGNFIPTFPAASPYLTAVGGTTGSNPEHAASLSAGGFSNYWSQPSYQTSAVQQYFSVAKNLPNSDHYNSSGAGFPDVAAQAESFNIVIDGFDELVSGTSCASPTFSAIIALLNGARLAANKNTLGYLNPLFYQNPSIFNDITSGNNPGCGTQGFYAAVGWDPITGLGTPNYSAMLELVLSLP